MFHELKELPEERIIYEYTHVCSNTNIIAKKYHVDQRRISEILKRNNITLHYQHHIHIDDKIGYLTIIEINKIYKEKSKRWRPYYLCKCICGKEFWLSRNSLSSRKNKSCGCIKYIRSNKNRKDYHGFNKTKLYKCWSNMKSRCFNKNTKSYKDYGQRGITVCNDWLSFINFKNWALSNGYKEGCTIERINVNDNYCPANCKWIERKAQSWNRRDTRYITYKNISKSVGEWSDILGLKHYIIYNNCKKHGWRLEPFLEKRNIHIPDTMITHSQELKDLIQQNIQM